MKNKLLIVLTLVMVLSLTFSFVACDTEVTVTDVKLVEGSIKTSYVKGEAVDLSSAKLNVTFSDAPTKQIAVTAEMFDKAIDTSKEGTTTYKITYQGKTIEITVVVTEQKADITAMSIDVVEGSIATTYGQNATVDLSNAKIAVTYSDTSVVNYPLTAEMFDKQIDTSVIGETTYTITYGTLTTTLTITITKNTLDYTVETFELPTFITNALRVAATEGTEDSNFKVSKRIYEVGNANAFLVQCTAESLDIETNKPVTFDVKSTYKVEVSETENGTYTELTGDKLKNFVTVEDGYKYFFTEDAAGKFVKLTLTYADDYDIEPGTTISHTINFKVIDKGYNVYDQDGLSVMNDNTRPELWADIWGCTVDASGNLQATDNVLTLDADNKPLYQYVGNIDWVILHGDITINPDKLPADFFWSKDSTAKGFADSSTITIAEKFKAAKAAQNAHGDRIGKEELKGTLIDGDGYGVYYSIAVNNTDDNNNKGLYSTVKVSVSGNYNAITVDKNRTESGRILKVLINKTTGNDTKNYMQMSQWYLFKMFNQKSADGMWSAPSDDITFELKNVALTGNGGKTEAVGPQGICMVNTFAREATIDNVVANGFYTNVAMDNYYPNSEKTQKVIITDSKMYDTYNAMAITWRGAIDIKNSLLKDAGGPLVLIMDGDTRDENPKAAKPIVTVDDKTKMEAMAMGNESWYAQLGSLVPEMFAQLRNLDAGLSQISGKTFVYPKTVGGETIGYMSVWSIMIPEGSSALDMDKENYKFTGKFVTASDSADMEDEKFREITGTIAQFGQGTMVFKSGTAYAFLWKDTKGAYVIVSYDMLMARIQAFAASGYKDTTALVFDTSTTEYQSGLQKLAMDWRANSSDQVTIWVQAHTGVARSPYLGLVIGGYHTVTAQ